jgi:hypothetical protein
MGIIFCSSYTLLGIYRFSRNYKPFKFKTIHTAYTTLLENAMSRTPEPLKIKINKNKILQIVFIRKKLCRRQAVCVQSLWQRIPPGVHTLPSQDHPHQ